MPGASVLLAGQRICGCSSCDLMLVRQMLRPFCSDAWAFGQRCSLETGSCSGRRNPGSSPAGQRSAAVRLRASVRGNDFVTEKNLTSLFGWSTLVYHKI